MSDFFQFLSDHSSGIFMIIIILFSLLLSLQWLAGIFRWGKYKVEITSSNTLNHQGKLSHILADFFVSIVNDFKHLLALIIILLFAVVLIYSLYHAIEVDTDNCNGCEANFDNVKDVMQSVVAALGGIIGSIIGYYFGESAARSSSNSGTTNTDPPEPTQDIDNPITPFDDPNTVG